MWEYANYYEFYKVIHVTCVIFWMTGTLVLPIIFYYHAILIEKINFITLKLNKANLNNKSNNNITNILNESNIANESNISNIDNVNIVNNIANFNNEYYITLNLSKENHKLLLNIENNVIKYIINPSLIIAAFFGFLNAYIYGIEALGVWFHIKFSLVLVLFGLHGFFVRCHKTFKNNKNKYSKNIYLIINMILSAIILFIVAMVIIKPFD